MSDEKLEKEKLDFNRRTFIGAAAALGAGAVIASCKKSYKPLTFTDVAPDGPVLKAGLVGCGQRGTGAALQFLKAGPNVKIVALGDVLPDHIAACRDNLSKKANTQVADDHCFIGFDAYKKVLDSDVDVVLLATPPHFRPQHFDAAVDAKKHCFIEKPCAVDAPGARSVLATGQKAQAYNLVVVAGTQRRHDRTYRETYNRVSQGAIGKIVGAYTRCNVGMEWYLQKKPEWSEMEAMIRDWINWCWLSGDHIVEFHTHNLDALLWFTGMSPVKALGAGGRVQKVTGDDWDFFNVQFTYPNGAVIDSMCRTMDGAAMEVTEYVVGTEGYANCRNAIYDTAGNLVWKYQEPDQAPGTSKFSAYDQEHIDFVTAIRTNQPLNEAEHLATATLTAIMGRTAAYTGREIKIEEIMDSNEHLGPSEYAMGPVPSVTGKIPVPGNAADVAKNSRETWVYREK